MSSSEDPNFELRIIRVDWAGKNDVAGIESAQNPISLQRGPSNEIFSAEVPAYPKVDGMRHGQLAVSTGVDTVPQLGPQEESIPMESVSDSATGAEWWIEKGEWKSVSTSPVAPGYHDAPSCRHGGTVFLEVGSQRCQVHFTPPGFTKEEFDKLLSDFQDDCWQLILSNESYTTAPVEDEGTIPGEKFIEHAREVLQAAKQVLKEPHRELQEVQSLQRTSRVRPVPRTFKELASKGWPKKVTGRSHCPDFNTPENQYVASIIERLLRAVKSFQRGGQARRDRLEEQISWVIQRVENIKDEVTQVNPSRLENFAKREEERFEEQLQEWRVRSANLFPIGQRPRRDSEERQVVFRLKSQPTTEYWGDLSFWVDVLEGDSGITELEDHQFRFDCRFVDTDFFDKGNTYEARLCFDISEEKNNQNKTYARWTIGWIGDVDIVQAEQLREAEHLRRVSKEIQSEVEERGKALPRIWKREEQQRERRGLSKRARFYNQIRAQWEERLETLTRLKHDLTKVRRRFMQCGIDSSLRARYPGTMVFVQEPAYRAVHAGYQDLQGASGFQEDLFDKLLSLDDLNILDLPTVYERWCLLQIVRVLREEYGFTPIVEKEEGIQPRHSWRNDMVDTVSQNIEEPFVIYFRSAQLQRYVELRYQPELKNGKRPDFLLKIRGKSYQNNERTWAPEVRIVLDAKFKDYKNKGGGRVKERWEARLMSSSTKRTMPSKKWVVKTLCLCCIRRRTPYRSRRLRKGGQILPTTVERRHLTGRKAVPITDKVVS